MTTSKSTTPINIPSHLTVVYWVVLLQSILEDMKTVTFLLSFKSRIELVNLN